MLEQAEEFVVLAADVAAYVQRRLEVQQGVRDSPMHGQRRCRRALVHDPQHYGRRRGDVRQRLANTTIVCVVFACATVAGSPAAVSTDAGSTTAL